MGGIATHSIDSLVGDLARLGVQAGDTVMVHASLRAIGPVEAGALGLIEALDRAVGPTGTLMMTLGADDPWSWVNKRPEHERLAALVDATPFDSATTPADPDVGMLAEVFRTAPGTRVNDHPEGRFGARGARAAALVDDPPWNDYYGPGSPLERFVAAGGKVLRLGADLDTVTLLHWAEYRADVPDTRRVTRHRRIRTADGGSEVRTISCLDDSGGIAEQPADEDYFATITRLAISEGTPQGWVHVDRVGDATCELLDGARLVAFGADWMNRHLV
ncbi:MAG: AAC(3) family N-acetyltransferase [Actinomycetota bacterium]|nr:AAC(3) family N-acetyltransferase [Actinomycetota bacterium]